MNILLLYATNSGNTYYCAQRILDILHNHGVQIEMHSVGDVSPDILNAYDAIILGSCTWNRRTEQSKHEEGQLQDQMQRLVDTWKAKVFPNKKFAVFGLGDSNYMHFCAAADRLEQFVKDIGGQQWGATLRIDSFPQGQEEKIDIWARSLIPLLSSSSSPKQ